jgi:hypothetical protein
MTEPGQPQTPAPGTVPDPARETAAARADRLRDAWRWATAANDIGQIASRALLLVVGMATLFAASGGLGILLMSIIGQSQGLSIAIPIVLRGGEIFLTIAAALLVFLIILSREGDAILTLFGVVIIAAIIVPTGDILRMATLVGYSPNDPIETTSRSGRGDFVSRAASDTAATRALHSVRRIPEIAARLPSDARDLRLLEVALGEALYEHALEQTEAAIRQRGLERSLLDTLDQNRIRQVSVMPAVLRLTRSDYFTLRDLGLITLPVGEFHNIRPTSLGVEVLCRIFPTDASVQQAAQDFRLQPPSQFQASCPLPSTRPATRAVDSVVMSATTGGETRRLTVTPGGSATMTLVIERSVGQQDPTDGTMGSEFEIGTAQPAPSLDPVLRIFQLVGSDRIEIGFDDDSGGNLNALIRRRLAPGNYEVQLSDFSRGSGSADVFVRRATQQPAQQ